MALASSSVFHGLIRIAALSDCAAPANSLIISTPGFNRLRLRKAFGFPLSKAVVPVIPTSFSSGLISTLETDGGGDGGSGGGDDEGGEVEEEKPKAEVDGVIPWHTMNS